jgi:hypothetical protein
MKKILFMALAIVFATLGLYAQEIKKDSVPAFEEALRASKEIERFLRPVIVIDDSEIYKKYIRNDTVKVRTTTQSHGSNSERRSSFSNPWAGQPNNWNGPVPQQLPGQRPNMWEQTEPWIWGQGPSQTIPGYSHPQQGWMKL